MSLQDEASDFLELEILTKEYKKTLRQYEQQKQKMMDHLKNESNPTRSDDAIKCGKSGFCVSVKNEMPYCYGSEEGCLWASTDCQTDADCTAKYDKDNSPQFTDNATCSYFYSIKDNPAVAWQIDTCNMAIEKTTPEDTKTMDALNLRLIELSSQIQGKITSLQTENMQVVTEKNEQFKEMMKQYRRLHEERKQIMEALNNHQYLDEKTADSTLVVEKYKSHYLLWVVFAILLILYFIKLFFFPEVVVDLFRSLSIAAIVFLLCATTYYLYMPQMFFLWLVLLIVFLIIILRKKQQ